MIPVITINGQPINKPDITVDKSECTMTITSDWVNHPRVRLNNADIASIDNKGKSWTIKIGSMSTLRIQHWDQVKNVNDYDSTFKITYSPPPPAKMQWGVVSNFDDNSDFVLQRIKELGIKWVRLWTSPQNDLSSKQVSTMTKYKAGGVKVILTIQPNSGWKSSEIRIADWTKRNAKDIRACVDIAGLGNEHNFQSYRAVDQNQEWHKWYVDNYLKPFKDTLIDLKVASVPIAENWSPEVYEIQYQKLAAAGAFKVADYADMHPYSSPANVANVYEAMKKCKAISGLPMISTEFNITTATDEGDWINSYPQHAANAKNIFEICCYYRSIKNSANQKGLISPSNFKLSFYDTFKNNL